MINIGKYIEMAINWLTENFAGLFDVINHIVGGFIDGFQGILMWVPFYLMIAGIAALAWWKAGKGTAVLTLLGLLLIWGMGFWVQTMQTVALVLSSTIIALLFGLGPVPGAFATVIFAMPPVVRLTDLGIRQVPEDIVEATRSFGATSGQLLFKVQLPLALPTIMAGVNQTIMMALSMVVIAAMISAGGLGEIVLKGITQMKIGLGFEGGIAVVILAIVLDRITQGFVRRK